MGLDHDTVLTDEQFTNAIRNLAPEVLFAATVLTSELLEYFVQ